AETLERTLAREVREEDARRKLGGADREDRRAHVAEDAAHTLVLRVFAHPLVGRDLVLGQSTVVARGTQSRDELCAPARELAEHEAPAAACDVDVLALDAVEDRWGGLADLPRDVQFVEGLFGDAADLDDDRTVIDLEAVDLGGGRTSADLVEALGDEDLLALV